MEPDRNEFLLKTIINYCDEIIRSVKDFNLDEEIITENSGYRAMLAFFVLQIGETARKLTQDFKDSHPEVDWRAIVGFRNTIAHTYGKVLPDILWDTVKNDIPELREFCEKVLSIGLTGLG